MNATSSPQTAVITGASAGLGSIYADRLARRGFNLLLVARRGDKLAALAASLQPRYGVAVRTMAADLASPAGLAAVADAIAEDGAISMLVNNAGTMASAPLSQSTPAQTQAMLDLNVTAPTRLAAAVLPRFLRQDAGTIINVGSMLAFNALPGGIVYSGTKGYLLNFTRGLQEELAATKIRVQLVLPTATATEIWDVSGVPMSVVPAGALMSAEDCVDAALAGLDQGESITMPSVDNGTLYVDFNSARLALYAGSRNGTPATRYALKK